MASSVLSSQTLNALSEAKSRGITFGALSEGEINVVSQSAGDLNARVNRDSQGNVTGFKGSESAFRKDIESLIKNLEKSISSKTKKPEVDNRSDRDRVQDYFLDNPDTYNEYEKMSSKEKLDFEKSILIPNP